MLQKMLHRSAKSAFTLVEVLISLVLAAILFTIVFRSYVSITQVSTRLENEKKLNMEITFITETVQNIADTYQIDYTKYGSTLIAAQWRTKTLYLTGGSQTGAMLQFSGENLLRIHANIVTPLISTGNAFTSGWIFKIIPFTRLSTDKFLDIQHPGFWLITSLRAPRFNPQERIRNVQTDLQQFYNLQRVE